MTTAGSGRTSNSTARGTVIPTSNRGSSGRVSSRAPIVLHSPEVTPSAPPAAKPLPALRDRNRTERRELLGTVTLVDSRRDRQDSNNRAATMRLKPGRATLDLIDRISRPGRTPKPQTGVISKPGGISISAPTRVPVGSGVGSIPTPLPPFPVPGGTVTHTGGFPLSSSHCGSVPWWCQPSYSCGSYWGSYGPVWTYPWLAGCWSPWYLNDPTPWCHSWALPWVSYSSFNFVWWHHGYWSSYGPSLVWTSRYWGNTGYDSYSDPIVVYADEDEEAVEQEPLIDREQFRAYLCDGWHRLSTGDPVAAVPLFDSALEGLSDVGLPWLLRSMALLLCDDLSGADSDLQVALELDPSLLAVRWQEIDIFGAEIDTVRAQLWSRLEMDPEDASSALMLATLALLSEAVPDAPARGALSEVLLAERGNSATVSVHGALRGEMEESPSAAALWLADPDCSGLQDAIP